jgi:hypothetical protein
MTCSFLVLAGFGSFFAVVGTFAAVTGAPWELVLLEMFLATVFGSPVLFTSLWKLTHRRWLEVTVPGFVLTGRGKRIAFRDEQVVGIGQYGNADHSGTDRVIRLKIDRGKDIETIECRYRIPPAKIDPLAAFIDRVVHGLARRTRENLSRGAALSGKRWRVDHEGLHYMTRGKRAVYPLECLSRASHHGGRLCVWKGEEERPFLRIRSASRNAYPLGILLHEAILANPAPVNELPGKPLGRMLLDRRSPDRRNALIVIAGSLLLCLICDAMALYGGGEQGWDWATFFLLAAVPHGVLLAGVFQFFRGSQSTIRFHEAGISQERRGGVRELLYTDVETMTWKGGKEVVLTPRAGSDRPVIRYRSAYGNETPELNEYRDHIATIIARRWLTELEKGPVTWTPRLRFVPNGLEYRQERVIGHGELQTVPFDKFGHRFGRGKLLLFVQGEPGAVVSESMGGANFFPGLMLVRMIWQRARPSAKAENEKLFAPRLDTLQVATLDKTAAQADIRITATGAPSRAVTAEIPDAGELVEDDE